VVLNLCIQALTKLEDNVCALEVVGLVDNLPETIDILVDSLRPLEVGGGLQLSSQCLDLVFGTEVGNELKHKLLPHRIGEASHHVVHSHLLIHKAHCSFILHE
jgi:hypothetical protein